jgi:GMP synthase-like glutamine amidotransferase
LPNQGLHQKLNYKPEFKGPFMRIHYLQHVPFESPAELTTWAHAENHSLKGTHVYKGESLPDPNTYDMLWILGGPMNVYEENLYPWLHKEKRCIEAAIEAQKKVLGLCLGAQLLSEVLGGSVKAGHFFERGWFPVTRTHPGGMLQDLPNEFMAFHWHGDECELPKGAQGLARSVACPHQAFQYGPHILALQFHLECNSESIEALIQHGDKDMLETGPYVQDDQTMKNSFAKHHPSMEPAMHQMLHALAGTPAESKT